MEYESRRDADDAYHEMHNKRIGRDDMLKIEVSSPSCMCLSCSVSDDIYSSGRVLLHQPRGALTTVAELEEGLLLAVAVMVAATVDGMAAVIGRLVGGRALPLVVAEVATTLLARMTDASAITTVVVTATALAHPTGASLPSRMRTTEIDTTTTSAMVSMVMTTEKVCHLAHRQMNRANDGDTASDSPPPAHDELDTAE